MVLKARAIFDCAADDDQELSFKENAIIVDSKFIIMIFLLYLYIIQLKFLLQLLNRLTKAGLKVL